MPLDSTGKMHHNSQVAAMHSKMSGEDRNKAKDDILDGKEEDGGEHTEVHDHGDGTFHTVHPEHGQVEHESIGHMHAHLSAVHGEPGHKHFHAHHDGMEGHSHSVESGGEPEHETNEDQGVMHEHLDRAMGEHAQSGISDGASSDSEAGSALGY